MKNKRNLVVLLIIVVLGASIVFSLQPNEVKMVTTQYTQITQKEAKEMMDNGNVIVLDVREEDEYKQGHIENSILVPLSVLDSKIEEVITDKDATVLVYCRSGNRSKQASTIMSMKGYTNVYEFGGINTWEYGIVK